MAKKSKKKQTKVAGLLGVGFDHDDGHKRITQGEDFLLIGGNQQTHEMMQDVAIRVTESLQNKGKRLVDAHPKEVAELILKALDR